MTMYLGLNYLGEGSLFCKAKTPKDDSSPSKVVEQTASKPSTNQGSLSKALIPGFTLNPVMDGELTVRGDQPTQQLVLGVCPTDGKTLYTPD